MEYGFWGALMLMVLMADPLGNIPITLACLKTVPNNRRPIVLIRECLIAMVTLLLAMFSVGVSWSRSGSRTRRSVSGAPSSSC